MVKKSKPSTYFLAFSEMAWRGYKNGAQLHNLYYRFLLDGTRCFLPAITMLNCFGVVPSENQHQMPKSTKLVGGFTTHLNNISISQTGNLSQMGMKNKEKLNPQPNLTDSFSFWVNPQLRLIWLIQATVGGYIPSTSSHHQRPIDTKIFSASTTAERCITMMNQWKNPHEPSNGDFVYIPRTQLTSIFQGQPSKTRPFSIKTRVTWVLSIYI